MEGDSHHKHAEEVVDLSRPGWTTRAALQLKKRHYARLKLTPEDAAITQRLYSVAESFFNGDAKHDLRIPETQFKQLDDRSGYIPSRRREMFELHDCSSLAHQAPPACREMAGTARAFMDMCRKRCHEALCEIAGLAPQVATLLADESQQPQADKMAAGPEAAGFSNSMLRVYRYSRSYYFEDGDAHHDMGVLTLIPRGTRPGLEIQPDESDPSSWQRIEKFMAEDEAILFGGLTLARLTGILALRHRIFTDGQVKPR
eukprot:Transcript_4937.p2 GENE.Transcript_4937~~Transcript_4937.p2  ORF type:complete len:281 (+),score=48.08 Transcript_4937:72-845(+)